MTCDPIPTMLSTKYSIHALNLSNPLMVGCHYPTNANPVSQTTLPQSSQNAKAYDQLQLAWPPFDLPVFPHHDTFSQAQSPPSLLMQLPLYLLLVLAMQWPLHPILHWMPLLASMKSFNTNSTDCKKSRSWLKHFVSSLIAYSMHLQSPT